MKRAVCVLLAASSLALAGEAEQPAPKAPPAPETDSQVQQIEILPDGRIVKNLFVRAPASTCYFIRTLGRPPEGSAPRTGFIPLQAKVGPLARGPDCISGAMLMPVPAKR